jgi:serine phosphatase RsbU (regulator of sigma subunit)
MPLGLMPGMPYEEQETTLLPGDRLLFYSDGLVEAHNPRHEMFGFPRLMALLGKPAQEPSPILFLLQELATFTGPDWEQEDDLTLVVLQRAADASRDEGRVVADDTRHTAELLMILKSSTDHGEE